MLSGMRVEVTVTQPDVGLRRDIVLDADESTPLADVIDELGRLSGTPAMETSQVISLASRRNHTVEAGLDSTPPVFLRGEPLDPRTPVADAGLKTGSILSIGDPSASLVDEPEGLVEIRVVAGTGAGAVHRLMAGESGIGTDPGCTIRLADDRVPPICVAVVVELTGEVTVRAMDGAADVLAETVPHADPPLALEREPLPIEATPWPVGAQLTIGDTLLELEAVQQPDAAVEDSPEPGWSDYNRPPRLLPPERPTQFKLPMLPSEQNRSGLPWLTMMIPVVMGVS
jgi:DNA segregation ATPase FtsK/SpoIIIE, S-DNA-T family